MLTGRNLAKVFAAIGARLAMVVLLVFCNAFFVRAHGNGATEDARVRVTFPFDNPELRADYMANASALAKVDQMIASSEGYVDVEIVSYSSLEGNETYNLHLSRQRAASVKNYILANVPGARATIRIASYAESWAQFRAYVASDKTLSDDSRSELLLIIDSDNKLDEKEAMVKADPNYKLLYSRYFRSLRYADITMRMKEIPVAAALDENSEISESERVDTLPRLERLQSIRTKAVRMGEDSIAEYEEAKADSTANDQDEKEYVELRNMVAAVKTNLLADAFTAINVEVEIPVWERMSLHAEFVTPWWETGNKYCFQTQGISAEIRYWFKPWELECEEKLRGWFAAPYVAFGQYDYQYDKSFNYQGEYWSAGLTAGYAMPVGKNKKANLELSLSVGYMETPFRHYYPTDDYSKLIHDPYRDGTRYWFGPTKAKVSLVIPITIPTGRKKEVSND